MKKLKTLIALVMVISILGANFITTSFAQTQYIINEITKTNKFNISITNNSQNLGLLCIASYKGNKLIDFKIKEIDIDEGQTEIITSDIEAEIGDTVKAFIWDNMQNIKTLSNIVETVASADKSILESVILEAIINKESVAVSIDGTEVLTTSEWVTAQVLTNYEDAITIAQNIFDDPIADQETVDNAVTSLYIATTIFDNTKTYGTLALVPEGVLLDAKAGIDFIAVLYIKDGDIYYNWQNAEGTWGDEVLIGTGTEGKIAVENNGKTHVAYTTPDNKIGYRMYNGTGWTTLELIESNNGGVCKWPDIAIDTDGNPRIVYVDTMGDTSGTTQAPDLMYTYKADGEFSKQVLYRSEYWSYYKSGSYYGEKAPLIAVDQDNNRYIFYQWRTYDHGMGVYHDRGIRVEGTNSLSLGSVGSNTNRFDIFDLTVVNGKLYALYRDNTNIIVSEMTVNTAGQIGAPVSKVVFAGSSAYSLDVNSEDIIIGSKDGSNLRAHYNETPQTFSEITVAGNAVSIVYFSDTFYAVYTDLNDGKIKRAEITAPIFP